MINGRPFGSRAALQASRPANQEHGARGRISPSIPWLQELNAKPRPGSDGGDDQVARVEPLNAQGMPRCGSV